nr:hypothetical protein [Micromonospora sp. DSM 115978]
LKEWTHPIARVPPPRYPVRANGFDIDSLDDGIEHSRVQPVCKDDELIDSGEIMLLRLAKCLQKLVRHLAEPSNSGFAIYGCHGRQVG